MAATLIEPTDVIEVKQVCCLLYGQPGARKSSAAQTADAPFTLAFDPGIYRAYGRRACALFETWGDVAKLGADADLLRAGKAPSWDKPYAALVSHFVEAKTIVTDTLGMCLEKMAAAIIAENVKHGNRMGGLSLQGYGVLKNLFAQWIAPMRSRGQHLVFICHEKIEKNGDAAYYCPDIVGGSYNTMMNYADAVGYMHFDGGKRVVDFAPTDQWMAKVPPCGWSKIELPDFANAPDFLAKLLDEAKASMGKISAESAALAATVAEWQTKIEAAKDLDALNAILPGLSALSVPAKAQVWSQILSATERAALIFDKPTKKFIPKAPTNGATTPTGAKP
jgi:hypothetical protein